MVLRDGKIARTAKSKENKTLKKSDEKIDKVIDDLRKKYGFNIIKRGGVMNLNLEVGRKLNGELETEKY